MFKKILAATDGSEIALKAAEQAAALAKLCGAPLHIVYVQEPYPYSHLSAADSAGRQDYEEDARKHTANVLNNAAAEVREPGLTVTTECIANMTPAEGVIEAARRHDADLIVIASHGRTGVARLLLGSVAQKVVALAEGPVLIVR